MPYILTLEPSKYCELNINSSDMCSYLEKEISSSFQRGMWTYVICIDELNEFGQPWSIASTEVVGRKTKTIKQKDKYVIYGCELK